MSKVTTNLQKAIDQIGMESVVKAFHNHPEMSLQYCEMHGHYMNSPTTGKDSCPVCSEMAINNGGNGTTATEVELYIDLKDAIQQDPMMMIPIATNIVPQD